MNVPLKNTPIARASRRSRWFDALTLACVGLASLALMAYVAYGEAFRTYPGFQLARLTAQGESVRLALTSYLQAGLPLKEFPSFTPLITPLLDDEDDVGAVAIFDQENHVVVSHGSRPPALLAPIGPADAASGRITRADDLDYQITLPLNGRFGAAGILALSIPRERSAIRINQAFRLLPWGLGGAVLLFGALGYFGVHQSNRTRQIGAGAIYLLMTTLVSFLLLELLIDGARLSVGAAVSTLGERLKIITDVGLELDEVSGIERSFADYRAIDPDINAIALVRDGKVLLHTNPALVGQVWSPPSTDFTFEYAMPGAKDGHPITVVATLPARLLYEKLVASIKNFLVLFFASTFISVILGQAAASLRNKLLTPERVADAPGVVSVADVVRPILFVGFFVENLGVSFMPQLMKRSAEAAGLSATAGSLMFMTYFLCFAASLLPAGAYAARHGAKRLIVLGTILAMAGLGVFVFSDHYLVVIAGRIAAGFGQGMLFIGSQSFILDNTPANKRTQGAGIIVFTFNGGMICGMALGSLLFNYLGEKGVFTVAVCVIFLGSLFAFYMVPSRAADSRKPRSTGKFSLATVKAGLSLDFISAVLFVGVPTKAVLTGVIIFAMPLILSSMRLPQEDIGQVMMFYAVGVLFASGYATRLADRLGATFWLLVVGMATSGLGLLLIGAADLPQVLALGQVGVAGAMTVGAACVGIAHGFINAPVITYVSDSRAAHAVGEIQLSAFYRFIERLGHIGGPLIMGQILYFGGARPTVIAWVGGGLLLCAALFAASPARVART